MAFADALIMTLGLSLAGSSSGQLKVENWSQELGMTKNQILKIATQAADVSVKTFEQAKGCKGNLVSVYISPTSVRQSRNATTFKLNYQLSYSQATCSNKLMIDCSLKIERGEKAISTLDHVCKNYPVKNVPSGSGISADQSHEEVDNRDEFSSNIIDDGVNEPTRPGSDFDGSQSTQF